MNLPALLSRTIRALLAIPEPENTFTLGVPVGGQTTRTLNAYTRPHAIAEALHAWRENPIARQIITLQTAFVIGNGLRWSAAPDAADDAIRAIWTHPLNQIDLQLPSWLEELARTGDLFLLFTVSGPRVFIRAVPSEQIVHIETAPNDALQETAYHTAPDTSWPAWDLTAEQTHFIRHYAINRPVGASFGESDLLPILPWLEKYTAWLDNRATLNRHRTAFAYVLTGRYRSAAERRARENEIRANPPQPGSVLVTNESEKWEIISAKLDASDASADGLALKKMIAIGAGVPLHWLAEPESATRTTAEAAGTPAFRRLRARQNTAIDIVTDILRVIAHHAGHPNAQITVSGDDITERDNATTSLAIARSIATLAELYDRRLIDETEYLRLVYRMAGEPPPENVPQGLRRPITETDPPKPPPPTPRERSQEE